MPTRPPSTIRRAGGADFSFWGGRRGGAGAGFRTIWPIYWLHSLVDSAPCWRDDPDYLLESVVDAFAEAHARALIRGADRFPRYMGVSFTLTDGAGFRHGPYGEGAAAALEDTDRRIGRIRKAMEAAGRDEKTLYILASSHGMELQDQTRSTNYPVLLADAGLEAEVTFGFVYLLCMEATVKVELRAGTPLDGLVISLTDDDRDPEGAPLALRAGEALVTLINGDGEVLGPVRVDPSGRATFGPFTPVGPAVTVRAVHPAYNPLEKSLPVGTSRSGTRAFTGRQGTAGDQGLNDNEAVAAALATEALLARESVDMVLTMRRDPAGRSVYEARSSRGCVQFLREPIEEEDPAGETPGEGPGDSLPDQTSASGEGRCGGCSANGRGGESRGLALWLGAVLLPMVGIKIHLHAQRIALSRRLSPRRRGLLAKSE